jgi:hypothetical protein
MAAISVACVLIACTRVRKVVSTNAGHRSGNEPIYEWRFRIFVLVSGGLEGGDDSPGGPEGTAGPACP